jgi:hypothetical protein
LKWSTCKAARRRKALPASFDARVGTDGVRHFEAATAADVASGDALRQNTAFAFSLRAHPAVELRATDALAVFELHAQAMSAVWSRGKGQSASAPRMFTDFRILLLASGVMLTDSGEVLESMDTPLAIKAAPRSAKSKSLAEAALRDGDEDDEEYDDEE